MTILNDINFGYSHYSKYGNDYYFAKPTKKVNKLLPGIYTIQINQGGEIYLSGMSAMTDTLIRLPDFTSENVIKEVNKFWLPETKAKFDSRQLVYKRGILLHGAPGVGKSACIAQIMEAEVNQGGIVFFCPDPGMLNVAIKSIREIQGNTRCLVVWEEFDELVERDESAYLSLLDGEMQIDNVVYLATTNYLDRIPNRLKKRPSRFASIIEIGLPNAETRRVYLSHKIKPDENIDIDQWVKSTEGFTIDHIKDLIISVLCLDVSFENALDRIKDFQYDEEKKDTKRADKTKLYNRLFGRREIDIDEEL